MLQHLRTRHLDLLGGTSDAAFLQVATDLRVTSARLGDTADQLAALVDELDQQRSAKEHPDVSDT